MNGRNNIAVKFIIINLTVFATLFIIAEILIRIFVGYPMKFNIHNSLIYIPKPNQTKIFASPTHPARSSIDSNRFRKTGKRLTDNPYNILVVGDSYTYDVGVNDNETWCYVLENTLRDRGIKVNVYNAGVPGYGTWQILLRWKELIRERKYDLTIYGYFPGEDERRVRPDTEAMKELLNYAKFRFAIKESSFLSSVYFIFVHILARDSQIAKNLVFDPDKNDQSQKIDYSHLWKDEIPIWQENSSSINSGDVVVLELVRCQKFSASSAPFERNLEHSGIPIFSVIRIVDSLRTAGIEVNSPPPVYHHSSAVDAEIGAYTANLCEQLLLREMGADKSLKTIPEPREYLY